MAAEEEEEVDRTGTPTRPELVEAVLAAKIMVNLGVRAQAEAELKPIPGTRHPVMLTNLQFRPVSGTGLTGNPLIFVKSHPHVRGRSSGSLSLITNEGLASSAKKNQVTQIIFKITKVFMTCFTVKSIRK